MELRGGEVLALAGAGKSFDFSISQHLPGCYCSLEEQDIWSRRHLRLVLRQCITRTSGSYSKDKLLALPNTLGLSSALHMVKIKSSVNMVIHLGVKGDFFSSSCLWLEAVLRDCKFPLQTDGNRTTDCNDAVFAVVDSIVNSNNYMSTST